MVSKICELLEDLDNAEDLCNYIEKWGKYLEIKDKNTELDKLIEKIESGVSSIEDNFDEFKEKLRKRKNFKNWRKKQTQKSKIKRYKLLRVLWRECKKLNKIEVEKLHEEKLKSEHKKKPKPPKKTQKRCELFIKILKYHDPAKAEKYEKELKDLCQDIQEPIKVNENYSPVISQELIQDYCELLTNPSHRKKREEEWKSYQLKSHD